MSRPLLKNHDQLERSYAALRDLLDRNGYAPSLQELADELGYSSKSAVKWHLDHLKQLGYIDFKAGARRTVRILKPWPADASGEQA